jgi:hypothetical protein
MHLLNAGRVTAAPRGHRRQLQRATLRRRRRCLCSLLAKESAPGRSSTQPCSDRRTTHPPIRPRRCVLAPPPAARDRVSTARAEQRILVHEAANRPPAVEGRGATTG